MEELKKEWSESLSDDVIIEQIGLCLSSNEPKNQILRYINLLLARQQEEMVEEIKKLADTTPPNLLLNAIVSKF